MKNALIDPVTLNFDLSTSKPRHFYDISQGHSLHQVRTVWDHSVFELRSDKQTDKQTDTNRSRRTSYPPTQQVV